MFKILLTASLLLTAGTSAYMSIWGLMQVFSEYPIAVGAMAGGMELGKILIIVYMHRNWRGLLRTHKVYYSIVVFALILITSLEIFGFLAQSYSKTGQETSLIASRQVFLRSEKDLISEELLVLEETLSGLPKTYVTKRLAFRKESGYAEKRRRLLEVNKDLDQLEGDSIRSRLAAGPIFAVSRLTDISNTKAIIIFIILLVGVVEPLSVGLTVAVSKHWMPPEKGQKMSFDHRERIRLELELKKLRAQKKFTRGK